MGRRKGKWASHKKTEHIERASRERNHEYEEMGEDHCRGGVKGVLLKTERRLYHGSPKKKKNKKGPHASPGWEGKEKDTKNKGKRSQTRS